MAQQVQARFRVVSHTRFPGWNNKEVMLDEFRFQAVQGEPFGPATPSAELRMVVANPDAAAVFIQAFETRYDLDVFFSIVPTDPPPVPAVGSPDPVTQPTEVPASDQVAISDPAPTTQGEPATE